MRSLERLALVGALAAAVTISGTLNARVKDLAQQRDIYQSRAANWEQDRPQLADRGAGGRSSGRRSQERPGSSADLPRWVQRSIPRGVQLHRLLLGAVRTYLRHRGRNHCKRRPGTGWRDRGSRPGHFAPRLCGIH